MNEPVIVAESLKKTYRVSVRKGSALRGLVSREIRDMHAVDGISFRIAPGEMVGYVGPNGAGKSTTIKMLTGILVPTGGQVRVLGLDPTRQRRVLASRIGVVFGQRTQLWWDLPLIESLELLRYVYRVPQARFAENLAAFRAVLGLDEFLHTPVRQLSLGQRMRGDLAAALLHDPTILYLDEPTIGLDVVAKGRIREFLLEIARERGVTVLLTTHDMADIAHLCPRMMILTTAICCTMAASRRSATASARNGRWSWTWRPTNRGRSLACPPKKSVRTVCATGSVSAARMSRRRS